MRRRTLLKGLAGVVGVAVATLAAVPTLISALAPAWQSRPPRRWRVIGVVGGFPVGSVAKAVVSAAIEDRQVGPLPEFAVYVWRRSVSELIVFSRACTDLGCPVNYDTGSEFFYCPCHGGIFNSLGEPVAGPPARPLYRYAARVRKGVLEIDLSSVPAVA